MVAIQVGQHWRTRAGSMVRVTADRGDGEHVIWRWAVSDGNIVNSEGRCSINVQIDNPNDLIELIEEKQQ